MYWLRKRILKYHWRRIHAAWKRGERLTLPLRVPSAFVTGSVGKTTTCRMVEHILASSGLMVAASTTQGTFIGGRPTRIGDSSNCRYASRLLLDRRVQACVFELARGGLVTDGIAFDGCDVGAVLNVYDNHVGLNGIDTREQMARVKVQVARAARKLAVLNADDPLCLAMREEVRAPRLCMVSMRADNAQVLAHIEGSGEAAYLDPVTDTVYLVQAGRTRCRLSVADIGAAFGGRHRPGISNALFAMAIAHGMNVEPAIIERALKSFRSDAVSNPGRMNLVHESPFTLLVTWADGREPMEALADFARQTQTAGRRRLVMCAMGNRPDDYVRAMAGECADVFDTFVCTDPHELRGRGPGEIALLLAEGLKARGVAAQNIDVVPVHDEGLQRGFDQTREGDLLVVQSFYSQRIQELGPVPRGRELLDATVAASRS